MALVGAPGCASGFGGAVGIQASSAGDTAVMLRAWSRTGSWRKAEADARTDGAFFWLPQLHVAAGWDLSQHGPRLELGPTLLGYASAPRADRGDWLWGVQSSFRGSFVWPNGGDAQVSAGFTVGGNLARVLSFTTGEEPDRALHTAGLTADATYYVIGDDRGAIFVGPSYEYVTFYKLGASQEESSRTPPPR